MALPEPCLVIDGSARVGVRVGVIAASQWRGQAIAAEGALESTFTCARAALAEAGLQLSDINSFAVCVGPGSVLGIRIAALAARTWATLVPRPIYVWESLAVLAEAAARSGHLPPYAVALESRLKRWNCLCVDAEGKSGAPSEMEADQLRAKDLPIVTTSPEAAAVFPLCTLIESPWAQLPDLFSRSPLLRLEPKPEALNPAADFATWDGERHRAS
jgi:tRNA threonylcarbamoyladenosine biosynthesis protein TsaB